MSVRLREERDGRDVRSLWVELTESGALKIIGQDLGPAVEALFGEGKTEYEWEQLVHPPQLARLLELLGIAPDADVLAALAADFSGRRSHELARVIREHDLAELVFVRVGE